MLIDVGRQSINHNAGVCLKNHSGKLHVTLHGIFAPNSVNVARYTPLIGVNSPIKWGAQLTESNL
ncbi:DUF6783 domain-containing protein [Blautia hominis]|uniref:DUF6783 domain-containing protein n=1 Tax=Blautia hominis TaxID=2025493 RepID=UPI0036F3D4CC